MDKATIRDFVNIKGKRIFIRADLNVPQDDHGNITDDTRIRESLATIRYCLEKGGRVILCSHLGRPKSKEDIIFSLKPVAVRLRELLPGVKITLAKDCIGAETYAQALALKDGQILLLENVRFYKEETDNDPAFAKQLAGLAEYYVNDAFGTAHRAHASTEGIAKYLPALAGFLMEKEIKILGEAVVNPKRPLTVILGGKKVADKIGVIDHLLKLADNILIGGGMVFTFIKAQGGEVGNSIVDESNLEYCRNTLKKAKESGVKIFLASDCVAGDKLDEDAHTITCDIGKVPHGWSGFDIGSKTVALFKKPIETSRTIIWNGPLGVFEVDKFAEGTRAVGKLVADSNAISIACGADTTYAVTKFKLANKFTHLSTGGGASLELLEGAEMPGVVALNDKGKTPIA